MKFLLLTFAGYEDSPDFAFFLRGVRQTTDERRIFRLSPREIDLINPNTRTCPVFRSSADAELTKRIYGRIPVLIDETKGPEGNPWGISFRQGLFNMTSDSGLFRTAKQLTDAGAQRAGPDWSLSDGSNFVPLYEAKMIHHFDHRWATYEADGETSRDLTAQEKADSAAYADPRYWVDRREVDSRLKERGWTRGWLMGWRDITNASNERTVVAAAFPRAGVGHTLPLWFADKVEVSRSPLLSGALSCLVLDYSARQKVGGTHLTYGYLKQLPIPHPNALTQSLNEEVVRRFLELSFTSIEMRPLAEDLGYTGAPFPWNEDRRAHLRAELDAIYAHLYGLTRDELRYILDPADIYGPDFPSETFRVLKEKDIRQFGEYRTARLVLQAWDRFTTDGTFMSFDGAQS